MSYAISYGNLRITAPGSTQSIRLTAPNDGKSYVIAYSNEVTNTYQRLLLLGNPVEINNGSSSAEFTLNKVKLKSDGTSSESQLEFLNGSTFNSAMLGGYSYSGANKGSLRIYCVKSAGVQEKTWEFFYDQAESKKPILKFYDESAGELDDIFDLKINGNDSLSAERTYWRLFSLIRDNDSAGPTADIYLQDTSNTSYWSTNRASHDYLQVPRIIVNEKQHFTETNVSSENGIPWTSPTTVVYKITGSSSNYNIPAANDTDYPRLLFITNPSATDSTLTPGSGTIRGLSSENICSGDAVMLLSDPTNNNWAVFAGLI